MSRRRYVRLRDVLGTLLLLGLLVGALVAAAAAVFGTSP